MQPNLSYRGSSSPDVATHLAYPPVSALASPGFVPGPCLVSVPSGAGIPGGSFPLQVGGTAPHVVSSSAQQMPIPALSGGTFQMLPASTAIGSSGSKVPKAPVKLPSLSGAGSLETFLVKFKHMARYLSWDEAVRYYHLCALLEGAAGQVLWDGGPQATTVSVLSLLRTRFGTELQSERFKAELRARRWKSGESLQGLYQDICRLVALAYPASVSQLVTHVAREAFIAALGDPALQLKVMEREPQSIDEAYNHTSKVEAFEVSLPTLAHAGDVSGDWGRQKQQNVCIVGDGEGAEDIPALREQMSQLCQDLSKTTQRLEGLAIDTDCRRSAPAGSQGYSKKGLSRSEESSGARELVAVSGDAEHSEVALGQSRHVGPGRGFQRSAINSNTCNACGEARHWAQDCSQRKTGRPDMGVGCGTVAHVYSMWRLSSRIDLFVVCWIVVVTAASLA